jgi:hypothetical protein
LWSEPVDFSSQSTSENISGYYSLFLPKDESMAYFEYKVTDLK